MSAEDSSFRPSWLCSRPADRARLLDMERRLYKPRTLAFAALGVALVASGRWVGWWTLAPLVVVGVGFLLGGHDAEQKARPEYSVALAWCLSEVLIAVSVALSGGPGSPGLAWLVLPVITLPA